MVKDFTDKTEIILESIRSNQIQDDLQKFMNTCAFKELGTHRKHLLNRWFLQLKEYNGFLEMLCLSEEERKTSFFTELYNLLSRYDASISGHSKIGDAKVTLGVTDTAYIMDTVDAETVSYYT